MNFTIHKNLQIIESKRLLIKPLSLEHCTGQYVSWLNDPEVFRYLESGGDYTLEMLEGYIKNVVERKIWMWGIHLKENNLHIGNIKIDPVDLENGTGEYGILMGERSEWGKGYAKEASEAIVDFCFTRKPKLQKITLGVVSDNKRAVELYQKMGFEVEEVLKEHTLKEGKYLDVIRMAIHNPLLKQ